VDPRRNSAGCRWLYHNQLGRAVVRIVFLGWVAVLIVIGCSGSGNSGSAAPAGSGGLASLAVVGEPTFPERIRVGAQSTLEITLRNDGTAPATGIKMQFPAGYFDGFILRASSPAVVKDSTSRGARFLTYPDLAPGQEQLYKLSVAAKTAGEYPATITISDAKSIVSQLTLKSTVVP
jgi:hypothetical protein